MHKIVDHMWINDGTFDIVSDHNLLVLESKLYGREEGMQRLRGESGGKVLTLPYQVPLPMGKGFGYEGCGLKH
ncbi:hypothetical protein E2C01_043990 [Portunus trituberculatus]|uniref:Uncharacterized protein n=1 Tax=Portunus trituberculatus TaxID=210409 RepID=A0A5B7FXM0_PORTR|nr:hypothetical protein [Portunus trituberculatus]